MPAFSSCGIIPWARNTCIGRSGAWAKDSRSQARTYKPAHPWDISTALFWAADLVVPFFRCLLCLFSLCLCHHLCRSAFHRSTRLGKLLLTRRRGSIDGMILAFAVASPRCRRVDIHGKHDAASIPQGHFTRRSGFARGRWNWGMTSLLIQAFALPVLVRGASPEATVLMHIHDAVASSHPDDLGEERTTAPAGRPSQALDGAGYAAPARPREPIQVSVARCQAEANLEAYGEALEDPVLRACILVPGRRDIVVRLPSAEGDEYDILEQIRQKSVDALEDDCHILPIPHQVLQGYFTVVAVPRWTDNTSRVVIVIDLTAVGGPVFADFNLQIVYRSEFARLATAYGDACPNVFTQEQQSSLEAGVPYTVRSNQVVHVTWAKFPPTWCRPPPDSFWSLWKRCDPPSHECSPWPGWLVVREDTAWIVPCAPGDIGPLYQAIADRIGCPVSYLSFQRDPSGFSGGDFTFLGRRVQGIVAVTSRDPSSSRPLECSFTFVDARRVGKGIRAFVQSSAFDAAAILRCIDPGVPHGFTASLHTTRQSTGRGPDDSWDWQEVTFRKMPLCHAAEEGPQVEVPATEAEGPSGPPQITGLPTEAAASNSPDTPGFYAAATKGPLGPAHLPAPQAGDPTVRRDKIWFLLFAPDRAPETLNITAQEALTWDEALSQVTASREPRSSSLYGHIVKVYPQPSAEFATLICLPNWACQQTSVIIDCRSFDGRLFCATLDPWVQWESFLLQTCLPDTDNAVVIVNGIAHVRGRPLFLKQGDLIQVIEYGTALPPVHDICDLLFSCDTWEQEEPLAFSSSFSHFWVLHDGGSQGIDADYHAINSVYGFQEFVADRLMYAQHRTTLKTAKPWIQDAVHKGVVCKAVVLVTECLPTLPVPPARITVPLTVVFLDLRPVLRGLDWRVFPRGEYALALLERGLNLASPPGFDIHIEGGARIQRNGVIFLQVEPCAVLTVSYRAQPSIDEPGGSSDDKESGSSPDEGSSSDDSGPSSRHSGSTHIGVAQGKAVMGLDATKLIKAEVAELFPCPGSRTAQSVTSPLILHRAEMTP